MKRLYKTVGISLAALCLTTGAVTTLPHAEAATVSSSMTRGTILPPSPMFLVDLGLKAQMIGYVSDNPKHPNKMEVQLTYRPVPGATKYVVLRHTDGIKTPTQLVLVGSSSAIDTQPIKGKTCTYELQVFNKYTLIGRQTVQFSAN